MESKISKLTENVEEENSVGLNPMDAMDLKKELLEVRVEGL